MSGDDVCQCVVLDTLVGVSVFNVMRFEVVDNIGKVLWMLLMLYICSMFLYVLFALLQQIDACIALQALVF